MGEQAGLNWNDGFMGGDLVEGNVIFNMVRETGGKLAACACCLLRVAGVALSPFGCVQIMVPLIHGIEGNGFLTVRSLGAG